MGRVIFNRFEVATMLNHTFNYKGHKIEIRGLANIISADDEDTLFKTIYNIVEKILISKISPNKTDLTNEDFENL